MSLLTDPEGHQEAFTAIAERVSGVLQAGMVDNDFCSPRTWATSTVHILRKFLLNERIVPLNYWRQKRQLLATVVLHGLECHWGSWKVT